MGLPVGAGRPVVESNTGKIQLIYCNSFPTIWEYARAMEEQSIDWDGVLGHRCALCGRACRFRQITAYSRRVVELFPEFRDSTLQVARFQCQGPAKLTFSMLPHQLVPYHQYTAESIAWAVWFVAELNGAEVPAPWDRALGRLPADANVTPWLLRCWLVLLLRGLRRGHAVLSRWVELRQMRSGEDLAGQLAELVGYLSAFDARAPPPPGVLPSILGRYGSTQRQFLLGAPSQHRRARPQP